MIVVRNVFQLKFGKAKDALALWKEGREIARRTGSGEKMRAMTDLVGSFYTLVMEEEFPSLADMEREMQSEMGAEEWKGWYQKFVPLVESGYREIFTVVE
ncbi:MAG: NIPSNAP family protein [Acidobacteriota bacterium]|nr:NIPSNAP family protein [Acidobacteriota bacterium]MDQ5871366.1 NIPSNAP family protein [Acidobacteriota bacterium]